MRLKSLSYKENLTRTDANPWQLEEISLGWRTLIIARNTTGKTRIVGSIYNLARRIQTPHPIVINGIPQKNTLSGEWIASFTNESSGSFEYL